uniref:Retrovirus-related Pol polyprotein from transposon TNT 1-94 n=1 Tax=Tanacetum cinerariifolium TaxID=118510 RepID=A0A6L2KZM6_TANCI|nr:retrovirus-related Pol polyprotein from transposon TNT 1-94 [Tanacetum cinerariifolium]
MVTIDEEGVDWTGHAKDNIEDYALMAFNSSNSGSDTEVTSCSKECENTYAKLKKLYDEQREQLGVASIEIQAYTLALKHIEISAKDKSGLGYGTQIHEGVLSYKNEVLESVFDNRPSDIEDSPMNDRFVKVKGIHAVPPPMTGIYMPPKFVFGIDNVDTLESVPKPVKSKPKAVSKPKVWSDAPIIKEYESDRDDEYVFKATVEQEIPSCAFINTVKHVKSPTFLVNAARQKFSSQAASTSTVKKVNTARQTVNAIRPRDNLFKSHAPIRRPFNRTTAPKAHFTNHKVNNAEDKTVSAIGGNREAVVKASDNPHQTLKEKGIVDSGCLRHMIGNKAYLVEYQDFNGGHVAFGGSKGQITDTEYLVLSLDFKLPDENQVSLRVPRQNNMYSFNLENIVPSGDLACLITKSTVNESNKWHRREYNNARAPQQNRVAERKNRTLIEAARTMLADLFLPNTFWAEAVSTACYVLNRVLVTKPQNKTPYELLTSKIPIISYIRPFGCHVTILNTIDHLGKFEEKSNEGFLVGYSLNSKAFRPVTTENKANKTVDPKEVNNSVGTQENIDAGNSKMEAEHVQEYYVLPLWSSYTLIVKSSEENNGDEKLNTDTGSKPNKEPVDQEDQAFLEELERLKRQEKEADDAVETLRKTFAQVDLPFRKKVIGIKWVYRNKKDERGVVVRNKARLVAQGHIQEEGIDYDEVFTLVARLEAIRIFLAFASYMGFIVYQIDVKSAFLYGKIDEEVYVSQISGFIDPKFPKKVYEVVKALYGLHQASRDWYATLSTFLVKSGYRRGIIDNTLFIKKDQKDIMLVQVYVDDIIFDSTKKSWCDEFKALMKNRFQMSSMEILKKFDFMSVKTVSTLIETKKPLVKDAEAADVDVHLYRSMIGSLMYLIASRPDIMYAVCTCSRFQVTPKTLHLQAVKRIFRYLKGQPKLGIWYPKESAFNPDAYSDSDYAGANLDRKSTTGEAEYVVVANCCGCISSGEERWKATGNFNKLDDLVGEGADYAVNKGRSIDKIKVLNTEAEGVSVAGETLSTATLAVSTVSV